MSHPDPTLPTKGQSLHLWRLFGLSPALPVSPLYAVIADAALVYATRHKKKQMFKPFPNPKDGEASCPFSLHLW